MHPAVFKVFEEICRARVIRGDVLKLARPRMNRRC